MEPLDKLSLKELLDLNSAVQEELTRRIQELSEENIKRKEYLLFFSNSSTRYNDNPGQPRCSVVTDNQTKIAKNPSWIKTGKLKATVGIVDSVNCRQTVFSSDLLKVIQFVQNEWLIGIYWLQD